MSFLVVRRCSALAAALAVAISVNADAQSSPIGRGGWIVGGTAGAARQSGPADQSTTSLSIRPLGLYFVMPRLAIGANADLGYAWLPGSATRANYGVGPAGRYFFGDTGSKTLPFVSAAVTPVWARLPVTTITGGLPQTNSTRLRQLTVDASAGLTRLISSSIGVTGEAYYTRFNVTSDAGSNVIDSKASVFGARFGFTIFIH